MLLLYFLMTDFCDCVSPQSPSPPVRTMPKQNQKQYLSDLASVSPIPMPTPSINLDLLHERNEILQLKAEWMREEFDETLSAFNLLHPSSSLDDDSDSICTDINMLDEILIEDSGEYPYD